MEIRILEVESGCTSVRRGRTCFYLEDIVKQKHERVMNSRRLAGQLEEGGRRQMLLNISHTTVDCYILL